MPYPISAVRGSSKVSSNIVSGGGDPIGDALRADCVAYWKLDEESGTRADASGNGNNAVPTNAPEAVIGKVNNAIHFDRPAGQYLTVADHESLRNTGNIYICGWVKLLSEIDAGCTFIVKTNSDLGVYEYELYYYTPLSGNRFSFYVQTQNEGASIDAVATIGDWYFLEAYYRAVDREMGFALNGGGFGTTILPEAAETTEDPVVIGADPFGPDFDADAHQDEFAIFKAETVPYDAETRAYLYNSGNGRTLYP